MRIHTRVCEHDFTIEVDTVAGKAPAYSVDGVTLEREQYLACLETVKVDVLEATRWCLSAIDDSAKASARRSGD